MRMKTFTKLVAPLMCGGLIATAATASPAAALVPATLGLQDLGNQKAEKTQEKTTEERRQAAQQRRDALRRAQQNTENGEDAKRVIDLRESLGTGRGTAANPIDVDVPVRGASAHKYEPGAPILVTVSPMELDMGKIPTNTEGSGILTLTNTGDKSMTVMDCKVSCGCTTTNCPKGKEIAPGESVEVTVNLKAGPIDGRVLNKTLTIRVQEQPPVVVRLKGEAFSYVKIEPQKFDPDKWTPESKLVIQSIDEKPFKITRMNPMLFGAELPKEAKVKHEIPIDWDWDRWAEMGYPRKIQLFFDHPQAKTGDISLLGQSVREAMIQRNLERGRKVTAPAGLVAAARDGDLDALSAAIAEGEDLESRDRQNLTPMMIAAEKGHVEIVETLMDAGADIEATDRVGKTPIMVAAHKGQAQVVDLLARAGANINARDDIGATALIWAAAFGNAEVVQTLLNNGAQAELQDNNGMSPLMWAAGFGDAARIQMLVDAGANLETQDYNGGATPLIWATRTARNAENMNALIKAGANLEARNTMGMTPLLTAAARGSVDKVEALLKAGADVAAKDDKERTALDHARSRVDKRGEPIIAVLEAAGAKGNVTNGQ